MSRGSALARSSGSRPAQVEVRGMARNCDFHRDNGKHITKRYGTGTDVELTRMSAHMVAQSNSSCLRVWTREEHEAVEAALDLSQLRTSVGLAAVLLGWVAVWNQIRLALVQPGAAATATAELLIPAEQALGWLAADLAELAPAAGLVPPRRAPPGDALVLGRFLAHPSSSWGVAYVLRGSRLGAGVLAPLVRGALELPGDCGTRFFASRGTNPGREWVSFRRRLDAVELPAVNMTATVAAARWTFRWVGVTTAIDSPRTALTEQASR